jgi:hypothetical protein
MWRRTARAGTRAERFDLESNVPALAASAAIAGSSLTVTVDGARAGARLDAAVARLACARSFVERPAGRSTADSSGRAHWSAEGLITDKVRDGRHVLVVWSGTRMVACAAIPSAGAAPGDRPWGIRSFTRRFVD